MIFGEHLAPAASAEPAAWLTEHVTLEPWTVGGLLPSHYDSYVLVESAPAGAQEWWAKQHQIIAAVAEVLAEFTDTPDRAWFAIWEGHGFGGGHAFVGVGWLGEGQPSAEHQAEMEAQQKALREEDARRHAALDAALAALPSFSLPDRRYFLLSGGVMDAAEVRWPGAPEERFRPDLWWPDDRAWFVATDVDFWCNYVGGSSAIAEALIARIPDLCHMVSPDEPLRIED